MYNHNKAQQSKNRVHISWDILYFGSKLWNNLAIDFKDTTDLALFRDRLRHWDGPKCDDVINFYV